MPLSFAETFPANDPIGRAFADACATLLLADPEAAEFVAPLFGKTGPELIAGIEAAKRQAHAKRYRAEARRRIRLADTRAKLTDEQCDAIAANEAAGYARASLHTSRRTGAVASLMQATKYNPATGRTSKHLRFIYPDGSQTSGWGSIQPKPF